MKTLLPTRSLALLMAIGFVDLIMTAVLHARGQIVELNPAMRVFIDQSEWLFAAVKGMTLLAAWVAMVWYAKANLQFVRRACMAGSAAYITLWCLWFFAAK